MKKKHGLTLDLKKKKNANNKLSFRRNKTKQNDK